MPPPVQVNKLRPQAACHLLHGGRHRDLINCCLIPKPVLRLVQFFPAHKKRIPFSVVDVSLHAVPGIHILPHLTFTIQNQALQEAPVDQTAGICNLGVKGIGAAQGDLRVKIQAEPEPTLQPIGAVALGDTLHRCGASVPLHPGLLAQRQRPPGPPPAHPASAPG